MMRISIAQRRLYWKELRQLVPLVVLLPLVFMVLMLSFLALGSLIRQTWSPYGMTATLATLTISLPFLYAVGVGGLLVGQEKDSRTIEWLSSLPISPGRIVLTKLSTGLLGLIALWCICIPVRMLWDDRLFTSFDFLSLASGFSYSAFLLLAGTAIAWRVKSAWVGLVCLLPVALILFVAVEFLSNLDLMFGLRYQQDDSLARPFFLAVFALLAGWLAIREGHRALRPKPTETARPIPPKSLFISTQQSTSSYRQLNGPFPALLWQFSQQNRGLLLGILAMLFASVFLIAVSLSGIGGVDSFSSTFSQKLSRALEMSPFATLLVFVGISWLGVLVFQSDSNLQRIRFLSDRGVAPSMVWVTRQAIPAALISIFLLALILVASAIFGLSVATLLGLGALFGAVIGLAIICYLAAQWVGQVFTSPILSALLGPVVSLLAVGFNLFCFSFLGTPVWLLLIVNLIPIAATWWMSGCWMDQRLGWQFKLSHLGWLAAYLLIPTIAFSIALVRLPSMPAPIAQEIERTRLSMLPGSDLKELLLPTETSHMSPNPADENSRFLDASPSQDSVDQGSPGTIPGLGDAAAPDQTIQQSQRVSLAEFQHSMIKGITKQLSRSESAVSISSWRVNDFLRAYAELNRPIGQDNQPSEDSSQDNYRQAVGLVAEIAQRLRRSRRIIEQDLADYQEIWLLRELNRERAVETLGEELYRSIAMQIGDSKQRRLRRREAIADSWAVFQLQKSPDNLGGYSLYDTELASSGRAWLTRQRRASSAVADLWLLSSGDASKVNDQLLMRIAQFWGRTPDAYGMGSIGKSLRADDLSQFTRTNAEGGGFLRTPASQWSAGWERQADLLAQNLEQNVSRNSQ